jgi:hypothetical protein
MKKIKDITIINKNILRLNVDAKAGDEIDLFEINQVDTSIIIKRIADATDEEYNRRLEFIKKEMKLETERDLLKATESLKQENSVLTTKLETKEREIKAVLEASFEIKKQSYEQEIKTLKDEMNTLVKQKSLEIELANQKKEIQVQTKINELENKLSLLQIQKDEAVKSAIQKQQYELEALKEKFDNVQSKAQLEKEIAIQNIQTELNETIQDQKEKINRLQLSKTLLNVKTLGEKLESWCYQEYQNHALHGFDHCTFEKDNIVLKDDLETKGSKADYIFKVYANDEMTESHVLTSVVCEMKSEDPNSVNKKRNADFYNKLDKDRKKKNCEYALLISELEWELDNDAPIRRVPEYEKMYVVRPPYFIVFLSIIQALGMKYKDILVQHQIEMEKFKENQEIIDEFEMMKAHVLEKSVRFLENELNNIIGNASKISDLAQKIYDSSNKAMDSYVAQIKNRIESFNITKINKKINKINNN